MKKTVLFFGLIFFALIFVYMFFNSRAYDKVNIVAKHKGGNMRLTTVFSDGGKIPSQYTCDGADLAPELNISEVPKEAKSLVLIVDDPDAPMGTWVHWLVYNLPAETTKINAKNLPKVAKEGTTDFGRTGWGGPCPPNGEHRYFFKLYALDKTLDLPQGVNKSELEHAIKDSVLEKTQIIGLYKRGK